MIHFLCDCLKSYNIAHLVDGEKSNYKEGNKSWKKRYTRDDGISEEGKVNAESKNQEYQEDNRSHAYYNVNNKQEDLGWKCPQLFNICSIMAKTKVFLGAIKRDKKVGLQQ